MKMHIGNIVPCCLALLCLLSSCQAREKISANTEPSIPATNSPTISDTVQSEPADRFTAQTEGVPVAVDGLLKSEDIQKIYYGPRGTLLVRTSDTLFWYDVESGSIFAQRPIDDWLNVDFYPVGDSFCAVGTPASGENAGGLVTSVGSTLCVFYDIALQETETITLNDLGDGADYIKCVAISNNGNVVAYCTMDKLYCYDRTSGILEMVLDLSYDQIESNNGLFSISALAFSMSGDKLLFCGSTYSLPMATDQYSYMTYGCISIDGSDLQNLLFQNFEAGSMTYAAGGYLFFEESMTSASGKLVVVDSNNMKQQMYSLSTASEGEAGLFSSQDGEYYATVKSGANQCSIRIYSRETGELVSTQTIEDANEEFFYRVPAIYILDSLNLCIIKLGGFNDIPSKVVMYSL